MIEKIKKLYQKYKEIILYLFFGVVTTIISLAACFITLEVGVLFDFFRGADGEPTELLDVIGSCVQWVSGVLVAFYTNKKWVFTGSSKGKKATLRQLVVFSGGRVATLFVEIGINLGAIALFDLAGYEPIRLNLIVFTLALTSRLWAKVISSVVVVISNYFISKLLVFRKKEK